jgi:hypothetical protein
MDVDTRRNEKVDDYIASAIANRVIEASHTYVDEATGSQVDVYVSAPPEVGKRDAAHAAAATVTLSVNKNAQSVWVTPVNAGPSFQGLGQYLFALMNPYADAMHNAWVQHNHMIHFKNKEAENASVLARLEKRVKELQDQMRVMSDEHNAWVFQQQLAAGMDPAAYAPGSKAQESYANMLVDAEDEAIMETDLLSDDAESPRAKKRARVEDAVDDKDKTEQ